MFLALIRPLLDPVFRIHCLPDLSVGLSDHTPLSQKWRRQHVNI